MRVSAPTLSAAVTFCAKKVASSSGDARRALDVCRVAADKAYKMAGLGPDDIDVAEVYSPPRDALRAK